jgi:5-hydroxyisourate hydrolase-like protein (transthyretin family)
MVRVGCRGWENPHPEKRRVRHPGSVWLVVLVFAGLWIGGAVATEAQTYRVAGIVVNDADGAPLGRTRVSLAEVHDRRKAESVITEADGRFEFRNVPAGKFSLEGAQRNFMRTAYQWHEGFSTAIVTGAGLDTENLVLRLIPLGAISGKVIDEAGEPVRNANVKLSMHRDRLGEDRILPRGFATTDDEGKYEFRDLIPAEYFVSVAAQPWYATYPVWANENGVRTRTDTISPDLNVAYARTYYNGATDSAGATPLSVTKGERLTADLHLNPVPALTVVMKMPEDPNRQFGWGGLQRMDFGSPEQLQTNMTSGPMPGEMVISGVPAGSYSVTSAKGTGMMRPTGQVVVTEDGQLIEPKAAAAMGTVKVRVKTARGESLRDDVSLSLRDEHRHTVGFVPVTPNGEVVFEGVVPGRYAVMAHFPGTSPYTIGKMVIGGVEMEGHDITVGEGATLEIDATLMAGIVSVDGVVKRKDGKPASGAMVALVPRGMEARTHLERIRWDQSDLDGTFTVKNILPGKYTLFAVEDAWGTTWLKEGVLEKYLAHGQELTIGELMNGTVTLPDALEAQAR